MVCVDIVGDCCERMHAIKRDKTTRKRKSDLCNINIVDAILRVRSK